MSAPVMNPANQEKIGVHPKIPLLRVNRHPGNNIWNCARQRQAFRYLTWHRLALAQTFRNSLLLHLLVFCTYSAIGQASLKAIDLPYGPFTVGFKHYLSRDSTRTYERIYDWNNQRIPRPIPISIWYPSHESIKDRSPLTVLNYMEILKEEEEWENLPNTQILHWFYYSNTPENQAHLREDSKAHTALKPASGKFPTLIYAPSYQASSIENFALCEYLASYGYVVISSPSRGGDNRFLEGGSEKDMDAQARDIEFLVPEAAAMPYADPDRMATVGFSFGGLSQILAQIRNQRIRAIVSLDGSVKYQYETLKKSPYFQTKKVDVPFIHMAQKDIPDRVLREDQLDPSLNHRFEFFDSLQYSKAYNLKFHSLTHPYFSTLGVLFQARDRRQDKSDLEIMTAYRWVCLYALKFLDAVLKKDPNAATFLEKTPEENGVDHGLISMQTREPQPKALSFQDFNELAAKQDYEGLMALYESMQAREPSLQLPEGNLNNLGLQLITKRETARYGIQVLLLAVELYPESSNLYDSLGESYLHLGDRSKAIESFEKSLKLNAQNQHARDRLRQLRE